MRNPSTGRCCGAIQMILAALHLLGLLRLDRGEPAEAIALITRSLVLRPAIAPVLASLARAYGAAGNAEAAAEAARQAVVLDPALPEPLLQLGYALLMQQDFPGAGGNVAARKLRWRRACLRHGPPWRRH